MSTTICIAATVNSADLYPAVDRIARQYEYGILTGIENVTLECSSGVRQLADIYKLNFVVSIVSPKDDPFLFSFGIIEELYEFERRGTCPRFFRFIADVCGVLHQTCEHFYLTFAGEWYADDKVFLIDGDIGVLLNILRRPGNVYTRLFELKNKGYFDDDYYPLVARVHR